VCLRATDTGKNKLEEEAISEILVADTALELGAEATDVVNPLNAELNPICHSLILLGDLTFMGTCIVIIFQYTGCFKKSFTTLEAYRNLYRGHT
jgi:hypothetical protein